jgi:hypothetical protein
MSEPTQSHASHCTERGAPRVKGITTYKGAADKGARSGEIMVWDKDAIGA